MILWSAKVHLFLSWEVLTAWHFCVSNNLPGYNMSLFPVVMHLHYKNSLAYLKSFPRSYTLNKIQAALLEKKVLKYSKMCACELFFFFFNGLGSRSKSSSCEDKAHIYFCHGRQSQCHIKECEQWMDRVKQDQIYWMQALEINGHL